MRNVPMPPIDAPLRMMRLGSGWNLRLAGTEELCAIGGLDNAFRKLKLGVVQIGVETRRSRLGQCIHPVRQPREIDRVTENAASLTLFHYLLI